MSPHARRPSPVPAGDCLDEMGNLSIALPPEAWRELLLEPWPVEEFPAWAHDTRAAIEAALRRLSRDGR